MRHIAGVDVGGTFTDIVLHDEATGRLSLGKLLTTPDDPRRAILDGLARLGMRADLVVHGTTLITNALIERRGVRTGLITSEGFRDVLEIGNELRYDTFDLNLERPAPLIERRHRLTVHERIGSGGDVVLPLDEAGVREAARALARAGTRSIAVAFFNAWRNGTHERRAREIVERECDGIAVSISSEIAPEIREYERFSTTAANAYVAPIAMRYLEELARSLGVPLFIMLSDGGIATAKAALRQPIALVESGPAAGAMGASFLARRAGWEDVIAFDMGGTTAKLSLVHGGMPHRTHELEVARLERFKKGSGLPLKVPAIELIEIGAGGGSIATLDSLGLLAVGPRSAGAVPGPACYGAGGTEATVTDADLVRGYLSAERFLGGRMRLDRARAIEAVAALGQKLGLEPGATAAGIARVVDNTMATAARVHIAEVGTDPHHYRMIAFGGAGPVHAYALARLLGIREVIFPRGAGCASAIGMLVAPLSAEFTRSALMPLDGLAWDTIEGIVSALEADGRGVLAEAGITQEVMAAEISAEMRYAGQGFEITVPLDREIAARRDELALRAAFEAEYRRRFSRSLGALPAEVVSWRVRTVAPSFVREFSFGADGQAAKDALIERRLAHFEEAGGFVEIPVLARGALKSGVVVEGPALIEEAESTAVIGPGASAEVDASGNLIMRLREQRETK